MSLVLSQSDLSPFSIPSELKHKKAETAQALSIIFITGPFVEKNKYPKLEYEMLWIVDKRPLDEVNWIYNRVLD